MTSPYVRRPLVLASIMASMAMIAIEATIVSTAMPQIAAQLGDIQLYAWVFGSFLLTQTAMTVVFGKLADTYGRKPIMLIGIVIFLVGSVLCGFAWSMPSLILFRLVQGIGAGAIQPVGLTVVGDLYSVEERGKIQGYLASVWGVSSVAGPFVGGLLVENLGWAWIFWINIPIGLLAGAGFIAFLKEDVERKSRSLDVSGAALFILAVASLMYALTEAGGGDGTMAAVAALVCAVSMALFLVQERRASDPMIALGLWTRRIIATVNAATLLSGMVMIGLTTFLPMFVQGVLGQSALIAGLTLTVMVLGWPVGATLAARNFKRFGLRPTLMFGAMLLPLGASVLLFLEPGSSPKLAALGSIVIGLGLGFFSTSAIVIVQTSVGWADRGSATASNIFSRNLGNTLGATVLGAVFNLTLAAGGGGAAPVELDQIRNLLEAGSAALSGGVAQIALNHSLHLTFWGVFLMAGLTLLLALLVPVPPKAAPQEQVSPSPAE
jgi:EmrB/QacA subfamily drug resistance transporter